MKHLTPIILVLALAACGPSDLEKAEERIVELEQEITDRKEYSANLFQELEPLRNRFADALTEKQGQLDKLITEAELKREELLNEKHELDTERKSIKELQQMFDATLDKVYGNLHPVAPYTNKGGDHEVLRSFVFDGLDTKARQQTVSTTFKLATKGGVSIRPRFTVYFLDRHGFITGRKNISWITDRVEPGEVRVEEAYVSFKFGPPVYWYVEND